MTHLRENFVVDAKGKRVGVFLPIKDYNKLMEELEELDDIKAYDKVMSRKLEHHLAQNLSPLFLF